MSGRRRVANTPGFVVRSPAGDRTEYRTLLEAMKAARVLVEAGQPGVMIVDRRADNAWQAVQIRSGRFLKAPAPRGSRCA